MLRGAMSVTAALPAVPHAVARRARPACSGRWGGGSSHRRHPSAEPAWTTGRLDARRRALRAPSETAVGPRSFRSAARLASSRDDDPGCAASDPGAKPPVDETVDDATPRPRGVVNGVEWASARVLELDANVPGWWSFPHERDEDGRFAVLGERGVGTNAERRSTGASESGGGANAHSSRLSFRDDGWTGFVREDLRPPRDALPPQKLSIAPMMEYTTPHFRHLVRLLTKNTWLYTEMEVDQTLRHTDHPRLDRFLDFPVAGHPTSLQLGGADPELLAIASAVAAPYGYDELNLNCGCPSPKVAGKGAFGASLMLEKNLVAECVAAMAENAGGAPVTVKCRVGVDDVDSYDELCAFVETVSRRMPPCPSAGDKPLFAIHARKALLNGLSPAENRAVPPLRYEWVVALARDFPHVAFALNGGIVDIETASVIANGVRWNDDDDRDAKDAAAPANLVGTMIGRASHADPWGVLATADVDVFGSDTVPETARSRRKLLRAYGEYCDATRGRFGVTKDGYAVPSMRHLVHPLQNLFYGEPNAKRWRRAMDDALKRDAKNPDVSVSELIEKTLREGGVSDETLDAPPEARNARKPNGDVLSDDEAADAKRARLRDAAKKFLSLPPPPTRTETVLRVEAPAR